MAREIRRCPPALKLALHDWAVANLAGGDEDAPHSPEKGATGRFSAGAVAPVVPLLREHFPAECAVYLGGREDRAGHLLANRLHKMYHAAGVGRGAATRERPSNWAPAVLEGGRARCVEAGRAGARGALG